MKSNGFTIIELLFALLIIAFLVLGSLSLYKTNTSNNYIDKVVKDVLFTKNSIVGSYMTEVSYEGINEERVIALGLFPPDITINSLGKCVLAGVERRCKVNVLSADQMPAYIPVNSGFQIIIRNLPNKYCLPLMTKLNEHFQFVAFPNVTGIRKSHNTPFNVNGTREYCDSLKPDQTSNLRVAHY